MHLPHTYGPPMTPPSRRLLSWLPLGYVRKLRDGVRGDYMDRYTLFPQGPSGTNQWRAYLHHFLSPDRAVHHDHPFAGLSIVLWGSYDEEVLVFGPTGRPKVRSRRVRWLNWVPSGKFHRIAKLHPGPGLGPGGRARGVWTLFLVGPLARNPDGTVKGWGFWRDGCYFRHNKVQ